MRTHYTYTYFVDPLLVEEESKIGHFQVVCVSVGLHHFPKLLRSLDPALENLS